MIIKKITNIFLLSFLIYFFFFLSCETLQKQEEKLAPPRSTKEIRLDDIRDQISKNPVRAIDLIWTYRTVYSRFIESAFLVSASISTIIP